MFTDYLRELQKVKLLRPEEESRLWMRYRGVGDASSRLRLIEAYQPLVFKVAMQVRPPEPLLMDAIQEGTVGLIEAVERFDHTRGVRFSTFAAYRIRGRILNALARERIDASLDQVVEEDMPVARALGDLEAELALLRVEDGVFYTQVQGAIATLSEREQSVLHAYLTHAEPREVATRLRISLSHFYRLQKQAVAHLRRVVLTSAPSPEAS